MDLQGGSQDRTRNNVRRHQEMASREDCMRIAITAAALAAIAPFAVSQPTPARATDIDDFRWDHDRAADCRVIETHTTNRWGDDVTVRRRVCS
jgi:hypothetical protein